MNVTLSEVEAHIIVPRWRASSDACFNNPPQALISRLVCLGHNSDKASQHRKISHEKVIDK